MRLNRLKSGDMDYYCYGDDTDLYYRDAGGTLWRNSPDFSQMDGSVDRDCVYLTVQWIYEKFAQQHRHSMFWQNVCREWISMAVNPMFVCDGPTVYAKKDGQKGGVMSGVVGTTLFSTVKAVVQHGESCGSTR